MTDTNLPPDRPEIPGYELLDTLGSRSMGTVFKARQLSLNRVVAIRVLDSFQSHKPALVQRLKAEAQAATLHHANITNVLEVGEHKGIHFLVMEHVSGFSLASRIARQKLMKAQEANLALKAISNALAHAWERAGIIHGNLRPENILVDEDGTIKVSDFLGFNLRTAAPEETVNTAPLQENPYYLEELGSEFSAIPSLDIRALGRILYHAITGNILGPKDDANTIRTVFLQVAQLHPDEETRNEASSLARLIIDLVRAGHSERFEDWRDVKTFEPAGGKTPPAVPVIQTGATQMIPDLAAEAAAARGQPLKIKRQELHEAVGKHEAVMADRQWPWAAVFAVVAVLALLAGAGLYYGQKRFGLIDKIKSSDPRHTEAAWEDIEADPDQSLVLPEETIPPQKRKQEKAAETEPEPEEIEATVTEREPESEPETEAADDFDEMPDVDEFRSYLAGMEDVLGEVIKRDYGKARQHATIWIADHSDHPDADKMRSNLRRVEEIAGLFDWLETNQSKIAGLTLSSGTRHGEIARIENGVIKVRRKNEYVTMDFDVPLQTLPSKDLARLVEAADPEGKEGKLFTILVASRRFADAKMELERNSDPSGEREAWHREWDGALKNILADRALKAISSDVKAGRYVEAEGKMRQARAQYAATDIFEWTDYEEVERLQAEIEDGVMEF